MLVFYSKDFMVDLVLTKYIVYGNFLKYVFLLIAHIVIIDVHVNAELVTNFKQVI